MEERQAGNKERGGIRTIVGEESTRSAGEEVLEEGKGKDKGEWDRMGNWVVQEEPRERPRVSARERELGRGAEAELKRMLGLILVARVEAREKERRS